MSSSDPQKEYDEALKLKEMGNTEFKKGNYQGALKHYSRICMWIGMNPCMNMSSMMGAPQNSASKDPLQQKTDQLRITAFLNIAQANVKLERWDQVKDFCSRVLKHDEKNEKALYRRGMAYRKEALYELARKDYTQLKEILAENGRSDAGVDKEFRLLEKNEKQQDKEFMKQMAKSMKKAQKRQNKKMKQKQQKEKEKEKQDSESTNTNTNDTNTNENSENTDVNDAKEDNNNNNNDASGGPNDLYIGNEKTAADGNGTADDNNDNDDACECCAGDNEAAKE